MKNFKTMLLATAAVLVVGTGVASTPAQAFDTVDWTWNKIVTENVVKDVNITLDSAPSGMVEIEKIQTQIGDVTATSEVHDITNNPPQSGTGGTADVNIPISLEAFYDPNQVNNPVQSMTVLTPGFTDGNATGFDDQIGSIFHLAFDLHGTVAVTPTTAQDAIDLPEILSTATAVGNNQTIESSVMVELHDGQFLFGGYNQDTGGSLSQLDTSGVSGNVDTNAAAFLTFAGAMGAIMPAEITATSNVSNILNASIDSSATAVGNNMDVTLAASTAADALMIADITQYSFADISATSTVSDITVNNYANMAALTGPLVSSKATAVGNNFSVKVTSPLLP
jgi:hypothetical protein